jgi:hypothetical protein
MEKEKDINSIGKYVGQITIGISVIFTAFIWQIRENNNFLKLQISTKDKIIETLYDKERRYILLKTEIESLKKINNLDSSKNEILPK